MGDTTRGYPGEKGSEAEKSPSDQALIRTFLAADLRGYTRFTAQHGDERAVDAARIFEESARQAVETHDGSVFKTAGDQVLATFASARNAIAAALELQSRMAQLAGPDSTMLEAGVGLDAGEPVQENGDFRGQAVNLAARMCSLAAGGEVLGSNTVTNLAGRIEGVAFTSRGHAQLKGFEQPMAVMAIAPESEAYQAISGPQSLPIGGFLGALPSGEMIGRAAELQRLAAVIEGVNAGTGQLVMLMGEPGVGKTRLAQEATIVLRDRGFLVVAGRCYEPRQSTPYLPFLEALGDLYLTCSPKVRDGVTRQWPYLAHLLPEHNLPLPRSEGTDERDRLSRAVAGFVTAAATERPVAILLDDLHWADEASLDLVQHLARHTRSSRVLILGTYRDVEVQRSHPLSKALRDLNREQLVDRLPIRRLPEEAAADLIRTTMDEAEVSREFADRIYANTEGNPFFTVEVLRTLAERGDLFRQGGRWERRTMEEIVIPESIRDAIGERIGRLSEETQGLLAEASVLGQSFGFEELVRVSDRTERETEDLVQDAVTAGILLEEPDDGYAFDHALTQQTLYAELSPRRRRRIHLAAAEAIETSPNAERRVADLAHHFVAAEDTVRALKYSVKAGDQAESLFAHAEAEGHYRAALELAEEGGDAATEAHVLEKLGRVLTERGRYEEAREPLERSMRRYGDASDEPGTIRAAVQLGAVHRSAGSTEEGITVIQELVDRLEKQDRSAEALELYIVLETLFFASRRYEEGLKVAELSADLARALGNQGALGRAEVGRGTELGMLGRGREGLAAIEAAIPLSEAAEDNGNLARALDNASVFCQERGELYKARTFAERNLAFKERIQNPWSLAISLISCGSTNRVIGDWDQARTHFARGESLVASLGFSLYRLGLLLELATFRLDEGTLGEARALAEEVLTAADAHGDLESTRGAQTTLAQVDLLEGRPERALQRMDGFGDRPGLVETGVTLGLPIVAMAYLECGNLDAAEVTVDEAIRRARTGELRLFEAEALVVRGRLMSERGRWEEAEHDLQQAIDMAAAMPYLHLRARALYERGLMEGRSGNNAWARETLQETREIFERLGALPYISLTEQALEALG